MELSFPQRQFSDGESSGNEGARTRRHACRAHAALAYAVFFADWDWPTAEREFKRAIELNPNSALSHDRYAECLKTRHDSAKAWRRRSGHKSLTRCHRK